jgi:hypothetical protein
MFHRASLRYPHTSITVTDRRRNLYLSTARFQLAEQTSERSHNEITSFPLSSGRRPYIDNRDIFLKSPL